MSKTTDNHHPESEDASMDTKELSKNWRVGMKRWKYLLIMIVCISILLIASFLVLMRVDENNEARYRAENYERIEENLTSFSEISFIVTSIIFSFFICLLTKLIVDDIIISFKHFRVNNCSECLKMNVFSNIGRIIWNWTAEKKKF